MWLALTVVLATGSDTRLLTRAELLTVKPVATCTTIPSQSFETSTLVPEQRLWFVTERCDGRVSGSLFTAGALWGSVDGPGLSQVEAVAFTDANGDGEPDVVVIASAPATGTSRAKQGVLLLLQQRQGNFAAAPELSARLSAALQPKVTARGVVQRLNFWMGHAAQAPALPPNVEVTCSETTVPLAISDDHRYGLWLDGDHPQDTPAVHALTDASQPQWLTARVQAVMNSRVRLACWEERSSMPHGGSVECFDPVVNLNEVVAAAQPPITFASFDASLASATDVAFDGAVLSLRRAPGKPPVELPLGALRCGAQTGEVLSFLGAIAGPKAISLFVQVNAPHDQSAELYRCDDPEALQAERECAEGGGTCIHDVFCVPTAAPQRRARVVTVPLAAPP